MLSVIIPAFKEPFLQKTIDSILENAVGDIEVIPVLDGYVPETPIKTDSRVKIIRLRKNQGMRGAINAGIAASKGQFIMKSDAHCLFGSGFDIIMTENCQDNWLMIPRRYSLKEKDWESGSLKAIWERDNDRPFRDYHYFTVPTYVRGYGTCMSVQDWLQRGGEKTDPKYDIDDTMIFQGSCWLANKKYFMKRVGFMDDRPETYGPWAGDQLEIGLKYWLGGGAIKVNKKAWYAHLSKQPRHYQAGLFNRSYKSNRNSSRDFTWAAEHWINNKEPGMIHLLPWLVEKFWPVPTWPEDRSLWRLI